jgi:hypothetical protein
VITNDRAKNGIEAVLVCLIWITGQFGLARPSFDRTKFCASRVLSDRLNDRLPILQSKSFVGRVVLGPFQVPVKGWIEGWKRQGWEYFNQE